MSQPTPLSGSRPPSVNLNLNVRGMAWSATIAIHERSNALRAEGREVFRLGLGQSPFPAPAPVVEALRQNAGACGYAPVAGLPELRAAVAAYHGRLDGISHRPEDVLIGPGSKELMFLLQLVYYGDLVIPTPSWFSYAPQARIIGRNVHLLPTSRSEDWLLSPEHLDAVCRRDPGRPRIVALNYPSNPTGVTYPVDEMKALAAVAREHGVVLLSDEIYGALHHRGAHISIARFYPEGTIVSSGLSKWCGAGGWRLGTFLFPPALHWLRDAMAAVASETYTSTSAPIQHAAVRAFEGGPEIDAYLEAARLVLRGLSGWCADAFRAAGLSCMRPAGGFYLFVDLEPERGRLEARGLSNGADVCERALDEIGVATLPGSAFGRPEEELTLRIAFVDFDGQAALDAAARLEAGRDVDEAWLEAACGPTVEAVRRLVGWLGSG